MIQVPIIKAKEKPSSKSQAYKNVHALRTTMRTIYRICGLDPAKKKANNGVLALQQARETVDMYVAKSGINTKGPLKSALERERIVAGQNENLPATLVSYVAEAYRLAQQIPSFSGMPDGKEQNTLRAIEALLKTHKGEPYQALDAIRMIIDPTLIKFKKPAPKVKKKVAPLPDLTAVIKSGDAPWGYQVPYYMIPKGSLMTWGSCEMWVTKGDAKPGKSGSMFFIHPLQATSQHKKYHEEKTKAIKYHAIAELGKEQGDVTNEQQETTSSEGPA